MRWHFNGTFLDILAIISVIGGIMANNGSVPIEIGSTFERLTVLSFHHQDKRWRRYYLCRCKCGTEKPIHGAALTSGNTRSCGCLAKEELRNRSLANGEASINQVIAGYRHKAKKSGGFQLTRPQFLHLVKSPCFYCGEVETNIHHSPSGTGDFSYNGIDRIDPQRGYTTDNTVSSCKTCNFAKSNRNQEEFIRWIKRTYEHLFKTTMASQWGI